MSELISIYGIWTIIYMKFLKVKTIMRYWVSMRDGKNVKIIQLIIYHTDFYQFELVEERKWTELLTKDCGLIKIEISSPHSV